MRNHHSEIYKHRIGTANLKFVDMDGNPFRNSEVEVKQIRHAFLFGCAEFSCVPHANGELIGDAKEQSDARFKKFMELFNYTTLPLYWSLYENIQGKPDANLLRKTAQWFRANGVHLKGHTLCWHSLAPAWLLEMNNEQILSALLARIKREVSDFSGLIDAWDVINEVVIMPIFDKYDNGITRICKDMGRIRMVREVFAAAKQANPDALLIINDFVCHGMDGYEILIEGCLEAGIQIDAIGIQSHMHQGYWGVEKTMEILERFSRFRLPIHFTECSLVSGHHMPQDIVDFNDYQIDHWPSTTEGEERQAREAVMHYKTLFAHPLVDSITWWDFVDGQWLGAPVGLITQENRIKPVYDALHQLIKQEWWTGPSTILTDDNGCLKLTGFLGEYQVAFHDMNGRFDLKGNDEDEITVQLQ